MARYSVIFLFVLLSCESVAIVATLLFFGATPSLVITIPVAQRLLLVGTGSAGVVVYLAFQSTERSPSCPIIATAVAAILSVTSSGLITLPSSLFALLMSVAWWFGGDAAERRIVGLSPTVLAWALIAIAAIATAIVRPPSYWRARGISACRHLDAAWIR